VHLHALLADVSDEPRILSILRQHRVETLFHAAAYKHVPIVEENPIAGLRNNVLGTLATARAAVQAGVSNFTLVSTDKAVRPTSIMGASKRLAELVCQMVGAQATGTRFSIGRFGNVMGSSGSVIPLFKRQIAAGGPVEVTHPQVARYFMTMSEAAELVIQAGAMPGTSGDVHVLDMGEQVNILSLARRMILLSGFRPVITTDQNKDQPRKPDEIRITFIGLRTGEKVTEELLAGPGARATIHPRIFSAKERGPALATIVPVIDRIAKLSGAETPDDIRSILQSAGIGYGPDTSASAETLTLNTPATR
jgi:FlaA1/EpsC-like NDP-sugar epimerase